MKIILFGAGYTTRRILEYISKNDENTVLAIADNNWNKLSDGIMGHPIISPNQIIDYDYDKIMIALDDLEPRSELYIFKIYNQLLEMGIADNKIVLQNYKYQLENYHSYLARIDFLRNLSQLFQDRKIQGAIAECGVWRGHFAANMNNCFPKSKLYLFDTFSGFNKRDMIQESEDTQKWLSNVPIGNEKSSIEKMKNTSKEIVRLRCPNRSLLMIREGYVPDTFEGIDDEFLFVNLDMDLYAPQLSALRFFAPRMIKGGVILLHDYFNIYLPGTRKAIEEFTNEYRFSLLPIADYSSIALVLG